MLVRAQRSKCGERDDGVQHQGQRPQPQCRRVAGRATAVGAPRHLGLTGTKFGCGIAMCGACTVFLDGNPLRSCSLPVSVLGDREVTTIEGVSGREAAAVQRAWVARDVPQCGYCQSGQVMSAVALLKEVKRPTDR